MNDTLILLPSKTQRYWVSYSKQKPNVNKNPVKPWIIGFNILGKNRENVPFVFYILEDPEFSRVDYTRSNTSGKEQEMVLHYMYSKF